MIVAALSPETVFLFLVNSSGAVALFVYLLIAVSQLRMRARLEREDPERLQVRMWRYPYLTWVVIAAIGVVIGRWRSSTTCATSWGGASAARRGLSRVDRLSSRATQPRIHRLHERAGGVIAALLAA